MNKLATILGGALVLGALTAALPAQAETYIIEPAPVRLGRVRGGLGFGVGFGKLEQGSGPVGNFEFRIGARFNRYLSAYYQGSLDLTFFNTAPVAGQDNRRALGAMFDNSFLFGLTLAERLDFAIGPSVDFVFASECKGDGCLNGPYIGVGGHFRTAITLARLYTARRHYTGFSIGLDLHATAAPGTPMTAVGGFGWDWY